MAFENLNFSGWAQGTRSLAQGMTSAAQTRMQSKLEDRALRMKALGLVGGFLFGGPAGAAMEGTELGDKMRDTLFGRIIGMRSGEDVAKEERDAQISDALKLGLLKQVDPKHPLLTGGLADGE